MDKQKLWKPFLHDSETNRQIAYVIDNTNTIEHIMKKILVNHVSAPADRTEFMSNVLLHSSILNLGAKFKLLHHIVEQEGWPKVDRNHFHTLLGVRNAFAHSDTIIQPSLTLYLSQDSPPRAEVTSPDSMLVMISSSGKYETIDCKEALNKFTQSYAALLDYLQGLLRDYVNKTH